MSTPEYSDALFSVLEELSAPAAATDMPLRSALCEEALALVDQDSQRELWARLQLDLGNSLSRTRMRSVRKISSAPSRAIAKPSPSSRGRSCPSAGLWRR